MPTATKPELVQMNDDAILALARNIKLERERMALRKLALKYYGPEAAFVYPHTGEEYNDENDFESIDNFSVKDADGNVLWPDLSLPAWQPYLPQLADLIFDPSRWDLGDVDRRFRDPYWNDDFWQEETTLTEFLRETMGNRLYEDMPGDWDDLCACYDIRDETKKDSPIIYKLVPARDNTEQ